MVARHARIDVRPESRERAPTAPFRQMPRALAIELCLLKGVYDMTDVEENCWSETVCQTCGSQFRGEPHILIVGGVSVKYCSALCHEQGLRLQVVSTPTVKLPPSVRTRPR
jgi:hypothetical protein